MTEEEFRTGKGPAHERSLSEFSDEPQQPDHINPLGQSERELEQARRLERERVMALAQSNRSLINDMNTVAAHGDTDGVEPLMQFFTAERAGHVSPKLATAIHAIFLYGAQGIVAELPRNPERTVALRKLLEARDCAMRAAVMK